MTDRTDASAKFVAKSGFGGAARVPISGDASNRKYDRLTQGRESVILMDAPPDKGEDVRPFIRIAQHLRDIGLSAPRILAADTEQGFLILEDLGDDLFARVLAHNGSAADLEMRLYSGAIDVLNALHQAPVPRSVERYTSALMTEVAALAFDWYLLAAHGANPDARADFASAMRPLLDAVDATPDVLILRDYHAENLLWLSDRDGVAQVGLLDFQDAMAGHPAYDLVSLLQDARRDVPAVIERDMIDRFCTISGRERTGFEVAYHVLGAQRNLRILGVFARLCVRDGKVHYPDLIPRVWGHLVRDLAHPALATIAPLVLDVLPEPTPDTLDRIKSQCGTYRKA